MKSRTIIELVGFQIVWFVCAFSAANRSTTPALLASMVFTLAVVWWNRMSVRLAALAAVSAAAGFLTETLITRLAFVSHVTTWPSPQLAPAWIVGLWLAFGVTLPATVSILGCRPVPKSVLAGAVFGPLAYAAGSRIGALHVAEPAFPSYVAIAGLWAAVLPLLVIAVHSGARVRR